MSSLPRAALALLATLCIATAQAIAPAQAPTQDPAPRPAPFVAAQRWALVVGASRYEHLGRLTYAASDAHDFADALIHDLGFATDTVRVLTDTQDDRELTPTTGHILGELKALLADPRRNPSDLFVFYFCGHGAGLDGADLLLPTDARMESLAEVGLPVTRVVDLLRDAGMQNVLVIVDACRQGAATPFGAELRELADDARLALVLGCEPGRQSYEDRYFGHGVFTHFLLEVLQEPEQRAEISGALWASRVMRNVTARVVAHTQDRSEPQRPVIWADPTREILLDLALPEPRPDDTDDSVAVDLTRTTARLAPAAQVAALATTAWELIDAGRHAAAIEVLKAVEQLGPLPPILGLALGSSLAHRGRHVEAARVYRELRERAPDSLAALEVTVVDGSGAVPVTDRATAARELWDRGTTVPIGLLLRMVEALLAGGASRTALEIARSAGLQATPGSRDAHYLAALVAILEQRVDDAELELTRSQAAAGDYPSDLDLIIQRSELLASAGRHQAAVDLIEAQLADRPTAGPLHVRRVWLRRQLADSPEDRQATLTALREALDQDLDGRELLLMVRAAGAAAPDFAAAVATCAARHPLDWQAQLAAAFTAQGPDLRERVAAIAGDLAPRPEPVLATMARLTLDGARLQIAALRQRHAGNARILAEIERQEDELIRSLHERIAPLAAELGADAVGWGLLAETSQRLLANEAFHRLFETHLGALVDAGTLPENLVLLASVSSLNTGRFDRFESLGRSLLRDRPEQDARRWLAATWHAVHGDSVAAADLLGDRLEPRMPRYRELGAALRTLLAAQRGASDAARRALAEREPGDLTARALRGLAWHALGDTERARAILDDLSRLNPEDGLFVQLALRRAVNGHDRWELAQLANLLQPGNPLLRRDSFAGDAGLAEFIGSHELRVAEATGPVAAKGGLLTLTVLRSGRVIGALEPVDAVPLVIQGRIDEFGNLEAEVIDGQQRHPLVAKLAPPDAWRDCELLRQSGQILQIWGTGNVPFAWLARPEE